MTQSMLDIPYNFKPRGYQKPFLRRMNSGTKRAILIMHRRAGKDKTAFNFMIKESVKKVGVYYYFFPTYKQGKKIIWDGIDRDGFRFLDHIPKELRESENDTEMKVKLKNGSIIQIVGTDNVDSIVGTNPVGCVFSEYSLQDPVAWDFIRPILAENGGWAVFCFTPRGQNHAYRLYQFAKDDPNWFVQVLTVDDTNAIPKNILEQERLEILAKNGNDALYQQEYYCSFDAPIEGAYYAKQLLLAMEEKRITRVPYDMATGVYTAWDLGIGDSTSIWFYQIVGQEIHIIDYYENTGEGLAHYAKLVKEKEYVYNNHFAPHDIEARELGTGKSRLEVARSLGINFSVIPNNLSIDDGIEAVRGILNRCWFDEEKCNNGILALKNYRKEFDEKNMTYRVRPVHDWSSHGCLVAGTMISTMRGELPIENVQIGDYVITPFGKRRVLASGISKMAEYLIEVKTNKGNILTMTPEHKVFVDEGIVRADRLGYNAIIINKSGILLWRIKRLFLREKGIGFREATTKGLVQPRSIRLYGKMLTVQCQRALLSIIKISIHLITTYQTSSCLQKRNTTYYMVSVKNGMDQRTISDNLIGQERRHQNGTEAKRGLSFTLLLESFRGSIEKDLSKNVSFVMRNTKQHIPQDHYSARNRVNQNKGNWMGRMLRNATVLFVDGLLNIISILKPEHVAQIVQVDCKDKPKPVYDLTIEHDHCYYADGILVSNSDAMRYLAISLPSINSQFRVVARPVELDPYD